MLKIVISFLIPILNEFKLPITYGYNIITYVIILYIISAYY